MGKNSRSKKDDEDDVVEEVETKKGGKDKKKGSKDGVEIEDNIVLPIDKVNADYLVVKPMVEHEKYGKSVEVMYDDPVKGKFPLMFQLDQVSLNNNHCGISSLHEKYCKTDEQRKHIKYPMDKKDPNGKKALKTFEQIDNALGSKEFKKIMFGKDHKKYNFLKCTKIYNPKEKLDKAGKPKVIVPNIKCKFIWYKNQKDDDDDDKKKKSIKDVKETLGTILKIRGEDPVDEDDKPIKFATMTDVAEVIPWGSKIRCIAKLRSIWISEENKYGEFEYAPRIQLIRIDVIPGKKSNNASINFLKSEGNEDFDDDAPKKGKGKGKKDVSDSEDEKPKKGKGKKDDSDSEDEKPKKGKGKKDDSDSEDEKPKKGKKKGSDSEDEKPKKGKKKGSDSEDEKPKKGKKKGSDSEDEKPKKGKKKGSDSEDEKPKKGKGKKKDDSDSD